MALSIGDTYKGGIVINLDISNSKILLMNTIDSDASKITYAEAFNAANNGSWGGYTDWRMPNQFELQYINKVLFLGVDTTWVAPNNIRSNQYYWTNSLSSNAELIRYNITKDVFNDLSIVNTAYARAVREENFDDVLNIEAPDIEGDDLISWDASGNSYNIILKDFLFNRDLPRTIPQSISNPSLNTFNISKFFIGNKLPISDSNSDNEVDYEEFEISFSQGWNIISLPFNISTLQSVRYINSSGTEQTQEAGVDFNSASKTDFGDTFDSFLLDEIFNLPDVDNKILIMKANDGRAWLTEFDFNGIGLVSKHQGYQAKVTSSFKIYFTAKKNYIQDADLNDGFSVKEGFNLKLAYGWNIISYPVKYEISATDFFELLVDKLIVLKDNSGKIYMPTYNYDGIGMMIPGQGYQVKMKELDSGQSHHEILLT